MQGGPRQDGWVEPLLPWASAWLVSLAAHGLAAAMLFTPVRPLPPPELQPAFIMVELAPLPEMAACEDAAMPLPDHDSVDEAIDLARLDSAEETTVEDHADPLPERFGPVAEDAEIPVPTQRPEPPRKMAAKARPEAEDRDRPSMADMPESDSPTLMRLQSHEGDRTAALEKAPGLMVDTASVERWQTRLMAHLERRKRYPAAARGRREEGTAQVRFRIDLAGNVLAADLVQSSGFAALNDEAIGLVR